MKHTQKLTATLLASAMILGPIAQASAQATYTVQPGEYLLKIAQDHGVSVDELKAWNGLSSDYINAGTTLNIENPGQTVPIEDTTAPVGGSYIVQNGDTLYDIAAASGISVDTLMAWNGLSSTWLNVGDKLYLHDVVGSDQAVAPVQSAPVKTNSGVHTVQSGDTLSDIAMAHGISVDSLMAWNGLTNSWLNVGDQLTLNGSNGTYVPANQGVSYTGDWSNYHTVQSGDTLYDIANAYGTTYYDLMTMNGLSSSYLNVGDQIAVPGYMDTVVSAQNTVAPVESADSTEETSETVSEPESNESTENKEAKDQKDDKKEDIKDTRDLSQEELDKLFEDMPEAAKPRKHKVVEGDTLDSIAKSVNYSVNSLREWNELDSDDLTVGDEIYVSNPRYLPEVYEVVSGDSLDSIAQAHNITTEELDTWNELNGNTVAEGDKVVVSNPTPRQHKVQPGEKLEDVAKKYAITKEQLVEWNNLPETVQFFNGSLAIVDPEGVEFDKEANEEEDSSEEAPSESEETETQLSEETTTAE